MFDRIMPRYDLMNRIMTGGTDEAWRKRVANGDRLGPDGHPVVLDIATGTGDLAFAIARAGAKPGSGARFLGRDDRRGEAEGEKPEPENVTFIRGWRRDASRPCRRHVRCLHGVVRVAQHARLRRGDRLDGADPEAWGTFICLEMTPFHRPVWVRCSGSTSRTVMPLVGGVLSGSRSAYAYLPESVEAFPPANELADRMRGVGLDNVQYALLGFGTVAIHSGTKAV